MSLCVDVVICHCPCVLILLLVIVVMCRSLGVALSLSFRCMSGGRWQEAMGNHSFLQWLNKKKWPKEGQRGRLPIDVSVETLFEKGSG